MTSIRDVAQVYDRTPEAYFARIQEPDIIQKLQKEALAFLQKTVSGYDIKSALKMFFYRSPDSFSSWLSSKEKTLDSYFSMYIALKYFATIYGKNPDVEEIGGVYGTLEEIVQDLLTRITNREIQSEKDLEATLQSYHEKLKDTTFRFSFRTFVVNAYGKRLDPVCFSKQPLSDDYDAKRPAWIKRRWSELSELQRQHVRQVFAQYAKGEIPEDCPASLRYKNDAGKYKALTGGKALKKEFEEFLSLQFTHILEHPEKIDALYVKNPEKQSYPVLLLRHASRSGKVWLDGGYTAEVRQGIAVRMITRIHPDLQSLMQEVTGAAYRLGEVTESHFQSLFETIRDKKIRCIVLTEMPNPSETASVKGTSDALQLPSDPYFQESFSSETGDFFLDLALKELARVHYSIRHVVQKRLLGSMTNLWPQPRLVKRMVALPETDDPHEPILQYKLKPYQQEGVRRCRTWMQHNLAGIIALDAGLGKTLICLNLIFEHIASCQDDKRPILVLCPKMLVSQWQAAFAKELSLLSGKAAFVHEVLALAAESKQELAKVLQRTPHVVFTTPSSLLKLEHNEKLQFSLVIVDEADRFVATSNDGGNFAQLRELFEKWPNQKRLLVTATPIRNSITDIWKLLELANGADMEGRDFFNQLLQLKATFMDGLSDVAMGQEVAESGMLDSFSRVLERILYFQEIVRSLTFVAKRDDPRIREEWDGQVPELVHKAYPIELTVRQRAMLNGALKSNNIFTHYDNESKVKQHLDLLQENSNKHLDRNSVAYRDLLEKARNSPQEVINGSPLWLKLMQKLEKRIKKREKSLIVCHHIAVQEVLKELVIARFSGMNVLVEHVNGETNKSAKKTILQRFGSASERACVLLLITKSGGAGLDFPDVSTLFALGEEWNDSSREQAESRHVRVGVSGKKKVIYFHAGLQHEKHMRDISDKKRLWAELALHAPPSPEGLLQVAKKLVCAHISELLAAVTSGKQLSEDARARLLDYKEKLLFAFSATQDKFSASYEQRRPKSYPYILKDAQEVRYLEVPVRTSKELAIACGAHIIHQGLDKSVLDAIYAAARSKKPFQAIEPFFQNTQKPDLATIEVITYLPDGSSAVIKSNPHKTRTLRLLAIGDDVYSVLIRLAT